MSIHIQNDSLGSAAAAGVGHADPAPSPATSPSQSIVRSGHRGADSVDLSSLSQNVAAASTAQEAQQTSRLKQLASLYRSGQYVIDATQVSHAMVTQALGEGSSEAN